MRNNYNFAFGLTLLFAAACSSAETADLVLLKGNVVTVDEARPRVEAVAVRGDRILAVGTNSEIEVLISDSTRVIDLAGKTVIPGLVDGHLHFPGLGADRSGIVELDDTRSLEEALEMIRRRVSLLKAGEWLTGRGWHLGNWGTEKWPTASDLDTVAPDNPVSLVGMHSHASWLNSAALRAAGITRDRPDPDDGIIQRDSAGNPAGILIENAQWIVRDVIPPGKTQPLRDRIRESVRLALSYGFTGAHDVGTNLEAIQAYRELIAEDAFPFRIAGYVRIWRDGELLDQLLSTGPIINEGGHRLTVRGVKLSIDGALGARGAALLEPYSDEPTAAGVIRVPPDQVYAIVRKSLEHGFTAALHAIGDRGNRIALDSVEKALKEQPVADHRIRVEHAQIVAPSDIPRFAQLGLIASFQWIHCTLDMPWAESRVGPERIKGGYAWRTFLNNGIRVLGGSDEGPRTFSPFMGFHAAVTRKDSEGRPAGGWYPEQHLTREEALRSYTIDAAYANYQEDILGSISPGKLADLTILSQDIMSVPESQLLATQATMTVVAGKVVFER